MSSLEACSGRVNRAERGTAFVELAVTLPLLVGLLLAVASAYGFTIAHLDAKAVSANLASMNTHSSGMIDGYSVVVGLDVAVNESERIATMASAQLQELNYPLEAFSVQVYPAIIRVWQNINESDYLKPNPSEVITPPGPSRTGNCSLSACPNTTNFGTFGTPEWVNLRLANVNRLGYTSIPVSLNQQESDDFQGYLVAADHVVPYRTVYFYRISLRPQGPNFGFSWFDRAVAVEGAIIAGREFALNHWDSAQVGAQRTGGSDDGNRGGGGGGGGAGAGEGGGAAPPSGVPAVARVITGESSTNAASFACGPERPEEGGGCFGGGGGSSGGSSSWPPGTGGHGEPGDPGDPGSSGVTFYTANLQDGAQEGSIFSTALAFEDTTGSDYSDAQYICEPSSVTHLNVASATQNGAYFGAVPPPSQSAFVVKASEVGAVGDPCQVAAAVAVIPNLATGETPQETSKPPSEGMVGNGDSNDDGPPESFDDELNCQRNNGTIGGLRFMEYGIRLNCPAIY